MRIARLRLSIVLLIGLVVALVSACDSSPAAAPSAAGTARQVTVVGSGEAKGTPDTVTVEAAITSVASDVSAAMNQTSERQQSVIDALVAAGLRKQDITTSGISLQPQFATDGNTISGYQATNTLTVTVREIDNASRVLSLITSTGGNATRIDSVQLSIDDDTQLMKDARAAAFEDAKNRAQQYADLSGLELGKVLSISEVPGAAPPIPVPMPRGSMADMAAAPVPIEPGQQTVSFNVTVMWELG